MADQDDGFLTRWSRRKTLVREGRAPVDPAPGAPGDGTGLPMPAPTLAQRGPSTAGPRPGPEAAAVAPSTADPPLQTAAPLSGADGAASREADAPAVARPAAPGPAAPPPPPTLDDVASLTPASDFSRFVRHDVDPAVRNAAMKKLFAAPQFNVMDGLDIYIDDYSVPSPLPRSAIRRMAGAAQLLGLDTAPPPPAERRAPPPQGAVAAPGAADPTPTTDATTDEDPDLRLQRDDPTGPPGPDPGPRPDTGRER